MRRRIPKIVLLSFALAGCAGFPGSALPEYPKTPAEFFSGNSYVPLDPLPVMVLEGYHCKDGKSQGLVLNQLPDNAVRIAVRQLDATGSFGFGPAQLGAEGKSYQVILDYINADVANIRFAYSGADSSKGGQLYGLTRLDKFDATAGPTQSELVVPVYVGIGLRLTANVQVLKGNVNLSSLGALAAAAQAQKITGSLIVQTLGITGKQVTSALPLPSELNPTTVQNAILALGSVKAIVYDQGTVVTPRVTGIYNPLPMSDQRTVNLIVSELAKQAIPWAQDCPR